MSKEVRQCSHPGCRRTAKRLDLCWQHWCSTEDRAEIKRYIRSTARTEAIAEELLKDIEA